MKKNFISLILNVVFSLALYSNAIATEANEVMTDQAKVTLLGGSYVENHAQIGLNFKLQPGWHIYWREAGDTGFPTTTDLSNSTNIKASEFMWPAPHRMRQKLQGDSFLESYAYRNDVLFPIQITAEDPTKPMDISAHVTYAICAEICIPGEVTLKLTIPKGYYSEENTAKINDATQLVPKMNGSHGIKIESIKTAGNGLEITASNTNEFTADTTIFVEGGEYFSFSNPVAIINGKNAKFNIKTTALTEKKDFSGAPITVTLVNGNEAVELLTNGNEITVSAASTPANAPTTEINHTILLMLVFAFIGGLILNIMPCVLPVLSIKLLGVIKHGGGDKRNVTSSFLITAIGIITSFIGFALITIWLKEAGSVVGWGLHFQQPYFIITLVVILSLFAANMWGLYEINLNINPRSLWARVRARVFSSSISTPSPQPSPIGKEGYIDHFLSGALATILATPCTAPFLGTAVGFAVTRGAFEILIIFTAMGLGLSLPYILFSMFPGMVTKLPKPGAWMIHVKKIMGILLAIAAIWLIWVLSNQLGRLAAVILLLLCVIKILKLWAAHHVTVIRKLRIPLLIGIIILSFTIPIKVSEKSAIVLKQDMWEEFKPQHIAQLVANGKIVFVDVTADWCLTCKVNAFMVLENSEIISELTRLQVVAMRADWTNRDTHISDFLIQYERAGIPFNIIYGPGAPNGIVLSELLSKKEFLEALQRAGNK